MSQQLAQALLKANEVTAEAVGEAQQRQIVFGGSLDTNLLEAGIIGEQAMLEALSRARGLPAVGKQQIDQIGAHIPRLFPLVFAETYHLVPYRLVEQELWVLQNGQPDQQLFARIHDRLRLSVRPLVTTEVRLHYAMHRLYGAALLPRFQNLLQKLDGGVSETSTDASGHVLSWGLSSASIAPTRTHGDARRPSLDVRGLLARLDGAADRDAIVEVLLGAAVSVFDFAGIFAVHGDVVTGWRGTTAELTQRLARLSLNVELPSVFQTIYATGGHYLGPLPPNSVNGKLLADMGREAPRAAFLAPITVSGKLAAILYADNGGRGVSSKRVAAVLLLAQRAGLCFENLIRRKKARADALESTGPGAEEAVPESMTVSVDGESWVVDAHGVEHARPTPDVASGESWGAVELDTVQGGAGAEDELVLEGEPDAASAPAAVEAQDDAPFSDITDNPKEALGDWEDVLVDTVAGIGAQGKAQPARRKTAPPSVTWDDVIAEAQRAQKPSASGPIEVAGTMVDERELLFDGLEAQDPEARTHAVDKLLALGTSIDDVLTERFPGRLAFDPLAPDARLPPFRRASGLCELLASRGASAAPIVLPHLESTDPVRRLFAVYFLFTVPFPQALGALARRLYDTEPRNRYLAADALRLYAHEPGFGHIVQSLRDQLKVPIIETQVATVQILGQLREPSVVPALIPLVIAKRAELSGASASALAVICGQAFGADVARWAEWWQTHYNKPRAAWLVESLRHASPAIVRLVHSELVLISGRDLPLDAEGPPTQREVQIRAWEAWWREVSKPQAPRA